MLCLNSGCFNIPVHTTGHTGPLTFNLDPNILGQGHSSQLCWPHGTGDSTKIKWSICASCHPSQSAEGPSKYSSLHCPPSQQSSCPQ